MAGQRRRQVRAAHVHRRPRPQFGRDAAQSAVAIEGRARRQAARDDDQRPGGIVVELRPQRAFDRGPTLRLEFQTGFVELGQPALLAIEYGQAGPRLPGHPDGPGANPARRQLPLHPVAGEASQDRDHARLQAERPRRPRHVEGLAARQNGQHLRSMDLAGDEPRHRGGLVDGRVHRNADQSPHGPGTGGHRGIDAARTAASASSSVG